MNDALTIAILIAATIPFVVSIYSAFSRATRVEGVDGYFVFDRKLDTDGFLKTTIGYSLQVASIALFFYWTVAYGILGPLCVCAAWAGGYLLLGLAVRKGLLDQFLGVGHETAPEGNETIHGFIGNRIEDTSKRGRKLAVLIVSLASIIGLGGTMMAEVDYSAKFFASSLDIGQLSQLGSLGIMAIFITFTMLYVLWGGYKSAVFTDRYQVPFAYVAFTIFGFGLAALGDYTIRPSGVGFVIITMVGLFLWLFSRRWGLIARLTGDVSSIRLTTFFTFVPIITVGGLAVAILTSRGAIWSWTALWPLLFPHNDTFLGFGVWGFVSLILANAVWQFIDISGLQRLQSISATDDQQANTAITAGSRRSTRITGTLQVAGVEAGIGWALIILTAVLLKSRGLTDTGFLPFMRGAGEYSQALIAVFVFTVFVYMLSTISGFISAISYISYFDILPVLSGSSYGNESHALRLNMARMTTVFAIASIFFLYAMLRVISTDAQIPAILYAIYAFQIVILPSACVAILSRSTGKVIPFYAGAVIASAVAGMIVAYITAVTSDGWKWFSFLGLDSTSWGVVPPLASSIVATLTFAVVTGLLMLTKRRDPGLKT